MNIKTSLLLVAVLFLLTPISASAANNGWQIVVKAAKLPRWFEYPTSSLKSILKLSVGYQQGDDPTFNPYETLYYNGSLPIGCDKLGQLSLASGAGGTIRVEANTDQPMDADQCDAVANAAGRLFLDLYLKKYPVYDIVVPATSFDGIIVAFQRSGFYQSDPSNSSHLVLSVVSDPPGRCQGMAF